MLGTDQLPLIDKAMGSIGVLESDMGMFPSHAANDLAGLGNVHILLWASTGFLL